jgi:hypothetical protein
MLFPQVVGIAISTALNMAGPSLAATVEKEDIHSNTFSTHEFSDIREHT